MAEQAETATDDTHSVEADDEALSSSEDESESDSDSDGGLPTSIAKNRPGYTPAGLAASLPRVPALIFGPASPVAQSTPGHLLATGPTPQGAVLLNQGSPTSSSTPLRQLMLASTSRGLGDAPSTSQLQVGSPAGSDVSCPGTSLHSCSGLHPVRHLRQLEFASAAGSPHAHRHSLGTAAWSLRKGVLLPT